MLSSGKLKPYETFNVNKYAKNQRAQSTSGINRKIQEFSPEFLEFAKFGADPTQTMTANPTNYFINQSMSKNLNSSVKVNMNLLKNLVDELLSIKVNEFGYKNCRVNRRHQKVEDHQNHQATLQIGQTLHRCRNVAVLA